MAEGGAAAKHFHLALAEFQTGHIVAARKSLARARELGLDTAQLGRLERQGYDWLVRDISDPLQQPATKSEPSPDKSRPSPTGAEPSPAGAAEPAGKTPEPPSPKAEQPLPKSGS